MRPRASSIARLVLDSAPAGAALRLLEASDRGQSDRLAVLTYHRVAPRLALVGAPGLVSASPEAFDAQMRLLATSYRVVGLHDVLEARASGRPIGRRAVLLTVDDAHQDFATHAWPVLRRLQLPVTLFVPTAFPGEPHAAFWWDWLYEALARAPAGTVVDTGSGPIRLGAAESRNAAYRMIRDEVKRRPHTDGMALVRQIAGDHLQASRPRGSVLDWEELRALAADGVTLAPHSRTHPLLNRLDPEDLHKEIAGSRADLERETGTAPPAFAYPSGAHTPAVRAATERAGIRVAFTTQRGLNRLGRTDWLQLRRINVGGSSSLNVLRAQIGRWSAVWS